jgi:tRNA G10  N-methylase Trm11
MSMNTPQSLFFLGRQPQLGLAEIESLYGADTISLLNASIGASILDAGNIDFARLGGSIKLTSVIDVIHQADWRTTEKILLKQIPKLAMSLDEGKIQFGLSVHGVAVNLKDIQVTALRLKKAIRAKTDQSVRVIPNQSPTLSTAQVIHNHLTGPRGMEIVLVQDKDKIYITRTVAEQDIEAYTKRDQARPKRDARVGMLPPKLAQIIVNLATSDTDPRMGSAILDPFCGTGVILQEATLMGFDICGSDIEPRMIEYTDKNLLWLQGLSGNPIVHSDDGRYFNLEVGDATTHTWKHAINIVACEGYLGQPFNTFPAEEKLRDVMQTCNQIAKGFLKNIAEQIESGTRLCVALPAWHKPNGRFYHLKLLDSLEELGYNRVSFAHVRDEELLYYRPDQVVARELLVITRK